MIDPSQENVRLIEEALIALRRDQSRNRLQRHGGHHPFEHGRPDAGHGHDFAVHRARHDRSLGGAARFRLLDALQGQAEPMGISEIAEAIGVDQPRASRLVNDAVERGLVRREVDAKDARRSSIVLTDAGRATLESAHDNRRAAVAKAIAGFTPEETATFATLFSRFVAAWPRD